SSPEAMLKTWVEEYKNAFSDFKIQNTIISKSPEPLDLPILGKGLFKTKLKDMSFVEHKSGARIIFKPLPDTHVVSVRAGFLGGLRADPKNKTGVSELISKTWLTGT